MLNKKIMRTVMSSVLVAGLVVGCGGSDDTTEVTDGLSGKVTVSGSTSVGPSLESFAEKFSEENPAVHHNPYFKWNSYMSLELSKCMAKVAYDYLGEE